VSEASNKQARRIVSDTQKYQPTENKLSIFTSCFPHQSETFVRKLEMTADYEIEHWISGRTERDSSRNCATEVAVNDRAATREAIISSLRRRGITVKTRSDWHAKMSTASPSQDWNYTAIALHHAGNSFSCGISGLEQIRKAEDIDFRNFQQLSYHYAIDCVGIIYEALDIREKGAHVEDGNTGVIGIVFLADFSVRGEAEEFGLGVPSVAHDRGFKPAVKEWFSVETDKLPLGHDEPTPLQTNAAYELVDLLNEFFCIEVLGGHREFALTHGTDRACPGRHGMILAHDLRRDMGFCAP
jgi:hypothetical protein